MDNDHVLAHRAKYHGLEDVEATIANTATGKRTRIVTKQDAAHAKLWGNLSQPQQEAYLHVGRCHAVVHGSQAKAVDLSRQIEPRGGEMSAEREQFFRAEYFAWQSACMAERVDFWPAVQVCGGEVNSISEITRSARRRIRIMEQLLAALDVMADIKGWK